MPKPHAAHPYAVAATSAAARNTRPPEGHAAVENAEAGRVALAQALALGPEAAEPLLISGAKLSYDARSRDDWELNTLYMDHDDYVFHAVDPREAGPEFSGVYHGVEGYIAAMEEFAESWSNLKVEGGPVKVMDSTRVLTRMYWTGQGTRSGLEMKWEAVGLLEFRDGLIIDQSFWWSKESARRHLGDAFPADW